MAWRFLLLLGIFLAAGGSGQAKGLPLRGDLRGEVKLEMLGGESLAWVAQANAEGLVARINRPGVTVEIVARREATGAWAWELSQGEVDLAELWPLIRGTLSEEAVNWSASGRLRLSGAGRWDSEAGPTGKIEVLLREGWARSDELDVELSGIELDLATTDLTGGSLPAGQVLRVAKVLSAGGEAKDFRFTFGLNAHQVLEVADGTGSVLGGAFRLQPFKMPLENPAIKVAADVNGVQLAELGKLMPWIIGEAQGKLRGRIEIAWDEVKGLRVRDGGLDIVRADDAEFRLARSPGLLTGNMPAVFGFLPAKWGWASRIGITNPLYKPLKNIELGVDDLRLDEFRLTFWPDGFGGKRTASIRIVGRPVSKASAQAVKVVALDINFHGALREAMSFGLNQEFTGFDFRVE